VVPAEPGGRLRNASNAPAVSERVMMAPPCMIPPEVHTSGAQGRRNRTCSVVASTVCTPSVAASGIICSAGAASLM